MNDSSSRPLLVNTTLSEDLVMFYDEFVAFQGDCAFLCDALSSMALAQIDLDDASRRGVSAFAGDLKCRVEVLKIELKRIQEKSCSGDSA